MADPFDALGKVLYEKMESLDPGPEPEMVSWEKLTSDEQDYYCTLAEAVAIADRAAQRR